MRILNLKKQGVGACVNNAVRVLKDGGVILFPTDTLYGLGADALDDEAVEKIYSIKRRDEQKHIHAIVADMAMMERYAEVSDMARTLAKEFMPGALTLILKKLVEIETGIARGIPTIGFRIPDDQFCLKLAREFGNPFTATSANISGLETESTVKAILKQLGADHADSSYSNVLKNIRIRKEVSANLIDLVIDAGDARAGAVERRPSTVVDLSGIKPVIVREGAVPIADIWNAIRVEQ